MKYVYILESLDAEHFYVGIADDLKDRLKRHNAKQVPHTSKYGPWRLKTYVAFSDEKRAFAFERYLKSASAEPSPRNASSPLPTPHSAGPLTPQSRS